MNVEDIESVVRLNKRNENISDFLFFLNIEAKEFVVVMFPFVCVKFQLYHSVRN